MLFRYQIDVENYFLYPTSEVPARCPGAPLKPEVMSSVFTLSKSVLSVGVLSGPVTLVSTYPRLWCHTDDGSPWCSSSEVSPSYQNVTSHSLVPGGSGRVSRAPRPPHHHNLLPATSRCSLHWSPSLPLSPLLPYAFFFPLRPFPHSLSFL